MSEDEFKAATLAAAVEEATIKNYPPYLDRPKFVQSDAIHHPKHYKSEGIEPIQYIQSHGFNFALGNVIKYVTRAGKKPGSPAIEDLEKARQYLDFEISFRRLHDEIH